MKNRIFKKLYAPPSKRYYLEGFYYSACELSTFIFSIDTFIISLRYSEEIIRYRPEDPKAFHQWLIDNSVRDVMLAISR